MTGGERFPDLTLASDMASFLRGGRGGGFCGSSPRWWRLPQDIDWNSENKRVKQEKKLIKTVCIRPLSSLSRHIDHKVSVGQILGKESNQEKNKKNNSLTTEKPQLT